MMRPDMSSPKTMTSLAPQEVPNGPSEPLSSGQIVVAVPPSSGAFRSSLAVQNPTHLPSGETNGTRALSVPAIGRASRRSRDRRNNCGLPACAAWMMSDRPSGVKAIGRARRQRDPRGRLRRGQSLAARQVRRRLERESRDHQRRRARASAKASPRLAAANSQASRERPLRVARAPAQRRTARAPRAFGDPCQLAQQIARALPAIVRILGEAGRDDAIERLRRQRLHRRNARRLVLQNRAEQARARLAFERRASRSASRRAARRTRRCRCARRPRGPSICSGAMY